ncbi:hypothetical protein GCM10025857_39550 [Alicyclobacillus contaminans]|nr:hypothetical protein GCM10025857_00020 [Alicyclobacillus contaminans]GMA52598.1 hypothetical protein GCM10025857_39550 [Alicyclobacillus contaminans]
MKFQPHAYQRYCINRLLTDSSLGLFLDMGLGKTVITLTAINDLKFNRFAISKVLVIAPKKVAEATWARKQRSGTTCSCCESSRCLGRCNVAYAP